MRFARLAAAFCGVALVSGSAQAAITFSVQRTQVDGTLDRVTLYALANTSTGDQSKALGADITVTAGAANGLKFGVVDTNFDGTPDTVIYKTPGGTSAAQAVRTMADGQLSSWSPKSSPSRIKRVPPSFIPRA